jgi:uncharacterized protein YdeI (YjbR/CyaY-like superfamily)
MNFVLKTDDYISKANDFAVPILEYLRQLVHEECPEVEEVIKWGFPCFDYNGFLCGITAHKAHCSFLFWKGSLMTDPDGVMEIAGKTGMGHFGRITSIDDLPDEKVLRKYIREAMELNRKGTKVLKKKTAKKELNIPEYFMNAIRKNHAAMTTFNNFSYTNKKEYVEWVTDARTEKTRERRLTQSVEWMVEGKIRNWKYVKC